jgi:hypothetical protein
MRRNKPRKRKIWMEEMGSNSRLWWRKNLAYQGKELPK